MKMYETPALEIKQLRIEDIISTSITTEDNETSVIPGGRG